MINPADMDDPQFETLTIDISYLAVGMEVADGDDDVGEIVRIDGPHNVHVTLRSPEGWEGAGMYCCVPGCPMHMPLFPLIQPTICAENHRPD